MFIGLIMHRLLRFLFFWSLAFFTAFDCSRSGFVVVVLALIGVGCAAMAYHKSDYFFEAEEQRESNSRATCKDEYGVEIEKQAAAHFRRDRVARSGDGRKRKTCRFSKQFE